MLNKSFYIVLAGAVMALSGANAAGTQVQTVQSTDRAYESVENRLSTVTTQIGDIIDTTGAQKTDITGLLNNKQNRPNESCEEGKNCLLVKDASGTEHWYPIIDCEGDTFLRNVGTDFAFGGGEYYGGYRTTSNYRACAVSGAQCENNQWMRSFSNGVVYGEGRAVSIAETIGGTIVSLPNNVQAGNVCVCRATGYRVKSGNTYGNLVSVNTDKWVVNYGSATTDAECIHNCAFDGDTQSGEGIDVPYYANIANTCAGPALSATMCTTNPWFASIVTTNPATTTIGYNALDSGNSDSAIGLCQNNTTGVIGTWCNNDNTSNSSTGNIEYSWCNDNNVGVVGNCQANSWVVRYPMSSSASNGAVNPELYGRSYCTYMDASGVAAGTVLTASQIGNKDFSGYVGNGDPYPYGSKLACVCQLKGYKNQTASTMTSISNSKYLYSGHSDGKCLQVCQYWCADYFANNADNGVIRDLAGDCPL